MRAEMASAEKQRKHQSKSFRQSSSFTLPRLRPFSRKSTTLSVDEPQSAAAAVSDDQKSLGPTVNQRASVSLVYTRSIVKLCSVVQVRGRKGAESPTTVFSPLPLTSVLSPFASQPVDRKIV